MNEEQKSGPAKMFSVLLKLAALGFLAIGAVCLLLVALLIYKGDVWAFIIYAEKPIPHFLGGIGSLFIAYVLYYGIHNTSKDWLRFGGRTLMATLSLALSLAAGEIGVRAWYTARQNANSMEKLRIKQRDGKPLPVKSTHALAIIVQPSEDSRVVYELQPNLNTEFGHRRVRTNSEGMRKDRDYAVEKPAKTIRIIGIGDSGMFGWDIEQNEDYMDVLETNLNKRQDGSVYEALNLAVPGYNTQLEVEMLRSKGLKYKPDIVVVGWCENDYSLPYFMLEKENYRRRDISFLYNLLFKRTKHTEVAPGFRLTDQREYDKKSVLPELSSGTDAKGVTTALKELKQMGAQNGFKVLVFGPMKNPIRKICKEVGIPCSSTYDLIPEGKYPREYLIYWMHPNSKGHAVLAEYLEKDLVKRGWLPQAEKKEQPIPGG